MSTPPYQQPYQPQYQAVPPYGHPSPRPRHIGKLIAAIILFIVGPLVGLLIAGIGSAIVAANIATSGDVVANGQQITLSSGEERTVYAPRDNFVTTCSVTAPGGKEISTSRSSGSNISNNEGDFASVLEFRAPESGEYRISCDGMDDSTPILVGPGITFSQFRWPIVAGLGVGAVCWIIAIILLVRRQQALKAPSQDG
ncbi:hypothetical protein [Actinomyces sp. ZJ308]|uniref:hypothetical protein n=1 Tax=Actinomyces sp. ZJ308 TaxID=2708342 RepID=UPI001424A3ED|nr:hypothetical protein [Actinomyces sp. ZJ308]